MYIRPVARIVVLSFNFNSQCQDSRQFFKTEHCAALCFTVVDFHLEPTLPQILKNAFGGRVCFTDRSPIRLLPLSRSLRSAFDQFASRLRRLLVCVLELLTLTVLRVCPLREAFGDSHIAISAFAPFIVLRACPLSEALGRSHFGILDFTTLTQFLRVDLRHSRTIRSSPFRAPLLILVAGPSPGGSIWTSLLGLIWLSPCSPPPSPRAGY